MIALVEDFLGARTARRDPLLPRCRDERLGLASGHHDICRTAREMEAASDATNKAIPEARAPATGDHSSGELDQQAVKMKSGMSCQPPAFH